MDDTPPICTPLADRNARDGARIAVVGVYRHYPDLPGIDYSKAARAMRIELDDGLGPFLDPVWSKRAIRPQSEVDQHLGRRVRVIGVYHKDCRAIRTILRTPPPWAARASWSRRSSARNNESPTDGLEC